MRVGILVAILKEPRPSLLVIEEPAVAIHLGALQTLVEIMKARNDDDAQTVITPHTARTSSTASISMTFG